MLYEPAPSDGRVTYACATNPSGAAFGARVWRTDDRGQTWSSGETLPVSLPISFAS